MSNTRTMSTEQAYSSRSYNPYNLRWYNTVNVDNVTSFNRYIFDNVHKNNNDIDDVPSEYFGERRFSEFFNPFIQSDDYDPNGCYLGDYLKHLKDYYTDSIDELIESNTALKYNSCELHLIGTPEDVEELSQFPGLIVKEVIDETQLFLKDYYALSILQSQSQLIKYNLDTYYAVIPEWWHWIENNLLTGETIKGLHDKPYSESPSFRDPRLFESISPSYEHIINPDDRIYKIYIQMSQDLITTAYEKSNFFIIIRNVKKKMSIKNFIKYLQK